MADELMLVRVEFGEAPRRRGGGDAPAAPVAQREKPERWQRSRDIHGDPPSHRKRKSAKAKQKRLDELARKARQNAALSSGDPLAYLLAGRKLGRFAMKALRWGGVAGAAYKATTTAISASGPVGAQAVTEMESSVVRDLKNTVADLKAGFAAIVSALGVALGGSVTHGASDLLPTEIQNVLRFGGNTGGDTQQVFKFKNDVEKLMKDLQGSFKAKQTAIKDSFITAQMRNLLGG